jgi:hypothetical protein
MPQLTEKLTVKISPTQAATLAKLRHRKIRVGDFVRDAIAEKIKRDYSKLQVKPKQYCPF